MGRSGQGLDVSVCSGLVWGGEMRTSARGAQGTSRRLSRGSQARSLEKQDCAHPTAELQMCGRPPPPSAPPRHPAFRDSGAVGHALIPQRPPPSWFLPPLSARPGRWWS